MPNLSVDTAAARTPAYVQLLEALGDGRTGCLTGFDAGRGAIQVYVMDGDLLAAHAEDDDVRLLASVIASGWVPAEQVNAIAEEATTPGAFGDSLARVLDEEHVQHLLFERFRENVYRFLGADRGVRFDAMDAIFVADLQVVEDSHELVHELARIRTSAAELLAARTPLVVADAQVVSPAHARVAELCGVGSTVAELVRRAGHEPNRTLHAVQELLARGGLRWAVPDAPAGPEASPLPDPDAFANEPTDDAVTDHSVFDPAAAYPAEDDSYLDAFGDYDTTRGDGSFSGVRDRVALEDGAPPASEVVEVGAAGVSLNFGGRQLGDADARNKIAVINDVLAAVRAGLDADGAGTGQARVQLVLDGVTGPFGALFEGVELDASGRLPIERVLANLKKRPVTEHRQLLQRGSTDLIERALSLASEDLDDERMDAVLEQVAGYQQRLGI